MTNWSSYQSLIQLGAALNFGFAGFEFVFSERLTIAQQERSQRIIAMIASRKSGAPRPAMSAAQNSRIRGRLAALAKIEALKSRSNATLSLVSGVFAVLALGFMSFNADTHANCILLLFAIALSYLWVGVSIVWMQGARIFLYLAVIRPSRGIS